MKVQALILGASIGIALAFVPSCGGGGSTACNASNCATGCCTSTGTCDQTHAATACGKMGAACVNCAAMSPAQTCSDVTLACVSSATGGGSGSTGGGSGSTGGGSGSTGGGSGSTGGGSGSTGGGSGSTGGGSGSTGGGTGTLANCDITNPTCTTGTTCMFDKNDNTGGTARCYPGGCDLADVSTCSGATPKCTYVADANNKPVRACVAATGSKTIDQACTATSTGDDCGPGLFCYQNKCMQYCHLTDCPTGYACSLNFTLTGSDEVASACEASCDLFNPSSCGDAGVGDQCIVTGIGNLCVPVGTTPVGANCSSLTDCVRNASCLLTSTTSTQASCVGVCNPDGGYPTCSTGTCQDVSQAGETLGLCN